MLNACELEIDLFCRGLQIPPGLSLQGARGISRTRAGLGSGLELILPTDSRLKPRIWMNAPVVEPFAKNSPYVLEGEPSSAYWVRDTRTDDFYPVVLPQEPSWYRRFTSRDVPMSQVGVLQGTYLGIYVNAVCAFWRAKPALNCRFCTTGRNVGEAELAEKSLDDVIETCWAAKEESGITFVHFNGGYQGRQSVTAIEPFVRAVKKDVGLLVGVQLTPDRDLSVYDRLVDLGVDHLSFCLELLDPQWFADICPGKSRAFGQDLFFEAMERAARLLPRGAVSGELIAGLEPIANTIAGIERIASAGAFPTVCIFRPTIGSDLADWPSPDYDDMRQVMAAMYDACRRHRIPIGIAPNIEVSLVVTPDDAALLASRTAGFYGYELWRRTLRTVARPAFSSRLRTRH
jgi:hypothetical protein